MPGKTSIVIFGVDPIGVDFPNSRYSEWADAASIEKAQADAVAVLRGLGYNASLAVSAVENLADQVESTLSANVNNYDVVIIDASVRLIVEDFLLFEKLINIVRVYAPDAIFAFNDGPDGTVDAVRRWAPPSAEQFQAIKSGVPDRFEQA